MFFYIFLHYQSHVVPVNFQAYRSKHAIIVQKSCPAPLATFQQAKSTMGDELVKAMEEQGYSAPTPIQAKPLRNQKMKQVPGGVLEANFGRSSLSSFLPSWMKHETLKLTHESWIPLYGGPSVAHRSTWTWLDSCSQDWKWKDQRQLGEDSMRYIILFGDFRPKDSGSINQSQTIHEPHGLVPSCFRQGYLLPAMALIAKRGLCKSHGKHKTGLDAGIKVP